MSAVWGEGRCAHLSRQAANCVATVAVALCVVGAQTGCAVLDRDAHAQALAERGRLERQRVDTGRFVLTAFVRISQPRVPLHVYIEGDGFAWRSRTEPSLDPTPREATGLVLAAQDPGPNVVYLARPCQFTPMAMNPACGIPYWTGRRFAADVIESMNAAVSHFAALTPGQPVELIGYSGGGAVAVLIAARRDDVDSIRTVAGNLDDEFVNRLHGVSPMPESENAMDFAHRVARIAQVHFSGADDTVVPPSVAQRFVEATGRQCAQALSVPGLSHGGDWGQRWPALLKIAPLCRPASP